MSSISGRLPVDLERLITRVLTSYEQNITSVIAQFPAQRITTEIDKLNARLSIADRELFDMTVAPVVEVCRKYRHGVRGKLKAEVHKFLASYIEVEDHFQVGQYDKVVSQMQRSAGPRADMSEIVDRIFAHKQYRKRNFVVTCFLDELFKQEPRLMAELKPVLTELTNLVKQENSSVCLKARTILIACEKPTFDIRYNFMEKMFLDGTNKSEDSTINLQAMITDESAIFDVLGEFFYHLEEGLRQAALEVYIRRAFISYDVMCLQHTRLPLGQAAVHFQFLLPQSHPNRSSQQVTVPGEIGHSFDDPQRNGAIVAFDSFDEFLNDYDSIFELFEGSHDSAEDLRFGFKVGSYEESRRNLERSDSREPTNILYIAIRVKDNEQDAALSAQLNTFCEGRLSQFKDASIRRITFIILKPRAFPKYFTFRARKEFKEDRIYRHLEPALAFQLELNRLKNYDLQSCPTSSNRMHLYLGIAKVAQGRPVSDYRFFIRSIIRHSDLITAVASFDYMKNEGERLLLEALDELEVAFSHPLASRTDGNHIFLNFVPCVTMDPVKIGSDIKDIVFKYATRLLKLQVKCAEIRCIIRVSPSAPALPYRLCLDVTGVVLNINMYKEDTDPHTGVVKFQTIRPEVTQKGAWHGLAVSTPYMTKDHLEMKRSKAQAANTTYVYDFPELFRMTLVAEWRDHMETCSSALCGHPAESELADTVTAVELVVDPTSGKLVKVKRFPGENKVGMVAWRLTMRTLQFPKGREIMLIANDITLMIGSFGPQEDALFNQASKLARKLKIPRIYLAANSGARIGLATEVREKFKVAWEDEKDPEKGFQGLYLDPEDYMELQCEGDVVRAQLDDKNRYRITDIIGMANDIGVENLAAAGEIAGESARAYHEVVTIAMVSARAIGIGAYLVRLSQRVVQIQDSSIILTGNVALNKLLGREVYTSNTQLGGPQIMYNNGVTHKTEPNDVEGVRRILTWLSFMPAFKGGPLPIMTPAADHPDRPIYFCPPSGPYDPRLLITGKGDSLGLFDRDSWDEILQPWAQTVIVGRARLGGIPTGVVAVELRTVEATLPADPANADSDAKTISQAGQVWFPDSAYKTAQAIYDFNREELPLVVLANWRGFSGGMKDMFDQVVKFGAYIVDALEDYKQPILVYLPPGAELRGGSWVVIDPSINPSMMELYADPSARGGVLEPEAIVEIKYRAKEVRRTMDRLDPVLIQIGEELALPSKSDEEKAILEERAKRREEQLAGVYHQVAVQFAELHDTPTRMKEKGCLREVVEWKGARSYFYWRMSRKLLEAQLDKQIVAAQGSRTVEHSQRVAMLRRCFTEDHQTEAHLWEEDRAVVAWLEEQVVDGTKCTVQDTIRELKKEGLFACVNGVSPDMAEELVIMLSQKLSPEKREELIKSLTDFEQVMARIE